MFDLLFAEPIISHRFTNQIDPRAKLIILITFIAVLLYTPIYYPVRFGILAIFLLLLILFSDLHIYKLAGLLSKIYPMILLISLFQLFTPASHTQLYSGFSLDFSRSNLFLVLEFQLPTLFTFLATILFVITTPFIL